MRRVLDVGWDRIDGFDQVIGRCSEPGGGGGDRMSRRDLMIILVYTYYYYSSISVVNEFDSRRAI